MKSIIEQASSIVKAIEKAWNQAEQPKEFSIKIFEKEERNFFGMTTKPAKVGIFFGDKSVAPEKHVQKSRPEPKECRSFAPHSQINEHNKLKDKQNTKPTMNAACQNVKNKIETKASENQNRSASAYTQTVEPKKQSIQTHSPQQTSQQKPVQSRPLAEKKQPVSTPSLSEKAPRIPACWNETMIASAHSWLNKTLELMNINSVEFNSQITGKNLKLVFNTPVIADVAQEKQLFRSFAHLIMSSLRNQYKQEIKDLRIILVRME